MNGEIEKIMEIRGMLTLKEKTEMDKSIEILKISFERLIDNTRVYLLTGQKKTLDCADALKALQSIKAFADRANVEFPYIDNQRDAILYITKFGKEIVHD